MNLSRLRALSLFEDYIVLAPDVREYALAQLRAREPDVHQALIAMLAVDAAEHSLERPPSALLECIARHPEPPRSPRIGSRIGAWRITGIVGTGGMGTVYEAHRDDGQYQQRVALKCIRREVTSPSLVEAFCNERNILARLDHPGIAPLVDGGIDADGSPWFAMRYIEGETIDQWCDQRRKDVRQRVELIAQACDALAYAHQQGVLHQDIKPSNLLVTAGGQVQLVDFGLAAMLAGAHAIQRIAVSQGYTAPEALSPERTTMALDVYSIGRVTYLLLSGGLPTPRLLAALGDADGRTAKTLSELAQQASPEIALARQAADGRALARQLKGDLDAIVARCCAHDPADRYATALDLHQDLQHWLEKRPVSARNGGALYKGHALLRRNRLAACLVLVASATLASGGTLAYLQSQRAVAEAESHLALARIFEQTLGSATLSGLNKENFSSDKLLQQTEAQIRELSLQRHPKVMARGLLMLARNHAVIGNYARAQALADEASQLPKAGRDTLLEVEATRSSLLNLAGRPKEALHLAEAALARDAGTSDADAPPARLQLLTEIAQAQWNLAQREDAFRTLDRALSLSTVRHNADPAGYASLLTLRGRWRVRLQEFAAADADLREAAAVAAPRHPLLASDAQRLLAQSLMRQDRFKEAIPFAESLWQSTQSLLGERHHRTGSALILVGNARCMNGDIPGCTDAITRGEALLKETLGEDHPEYGEALASRTLMQRHGGESWEAMIASSRQALALVERHYPPEHESVIGLRSWLAHQLTLVPRTAPADEKARYMDEARELLESVVSVSAQHGLPPPPLSRIYLSRRLIEKSLEENSARAEQLLKDNAAFLAGHYPPGHSHHDSNNTGLAHLLVLTGKLEEADLICQQIEKNNRPQLPNPNAHVRFNAALILRAYIAVEQGDKQRALALLDEAHAVASQSYPADHRLVLTAERARNDLLRTGRF